MKKSERKIESKNYFILAAVAILVVLLTMYICKWISLYKEQTLATSPLTSIIKEFDLNELNEAASEMSDSIIYFSYTNDQDIYSLDNKFKRVIERKNIEEDVYYVNLNNYLENDKYIEMIVSVFPELERENLKAPLIIYTKQGSALKVKASNSKIITQQDFENLSGLLETE